MSGIFGWFHYQTSNDKQRNILNNILSCLGSDLDSSEGIVDSDFALYACGNDTSFACNTEKNIYIAVSGSVTYEKNTPIKNSAEQTLDNYLRFGIKFIERATGSFSIIIIDKSADIFYIATDRMGVQPLSYSKLN